MPGTDAFADIEGSPLETDDDGLARTPVVDWRALLALLAMCCVVAFSWANWGSHVTVAFLCTQVELSVMWVIILSMLVGSAATMLVQVAYRRFRTERTALEKAARESDAQAAEAEGKR